jgi:hypothetical protein
MVFNLSSPRFSPKSSSQRRLTSRSSSSTSTLSEALRTNPFAPKSKTTTLEVDDGAELLELNRDLLTLATVFPDIKTEVLRELILRFPGDSRLQICVEQLLKYRAEWVKGRWNVPSADLTDSLPAEERFRSVEYKAATKNALQDEFRGLSSSAIDAVLAEKNFSYTQARPVLRELARRSWWATIGKLNYFKRKREQNDMPPELFKRSSSLGGDFYFTGTGCAELDEELVCLFLEPLSVQKRQLQEEEDQKVAIAANQLEAAASQALYECDCCCGETNFEMMSMCTNNFHIICNECIRRTMHEALFGQGWGKSVDIERGTLKCLAPLVNETCEGCIPSPLVRQALLMAQSGAETLNKFDDRLAAESLLKSQMKLIRCPFCSYAEADPIHYPGSPQSLRWHIKSPNTLATIFALIIFIDLSPLLLLLILIASFLTLRPTDLFKNAIQNVSLRTRSPRFTCRNPSCLRKSCLKCSKAWHDPHTCHEPLLISLRTSVEAARTAAVKRTCPRCGLSFVKASGCNKLTCVCGYAMCYLCRKALGPPADGARRGGAGEEEEGGYRHFCEHFRVNPGKPCSECRKCDLYRAEDEDEVVRRAGEEAERQWRIKEGMVGVDGLEVLPPDAEGQSSSVLETLLTGRWTLQKVVDWGVGKVIEVEA